MPLIRNHHSSKITKLLLMGQSGSGKSGCLCSLAAAGYNVRILDLDNGIDVIKNLLLAKASKYPPEAADRVVYKTLTDPMRVVGNVMVPKLATVWQRTIKMLEHWKTEDEDLGPVLSWGPQDVLVIDSLTFLGIAAMNFVLSMNGRLGQQTQQSDWYQAQQRVEQFLQAIYDENIKCNVIMTAHVRITEEDNMPPRATVHSLGKALTPVIGRYFNSTLYVQTSGSGAQERRRILTRSTSLVELKNTAPLNVKPDYPIETGLAEYFHDVQHAGEGGVAPSAKTNGQSEVLAVPSTVQQQKV